MYFINLNYTDNKELLDEAFCPERMKDIFKDTRGRKNVICVTNKLILHHVAFNVNYEEMCNITKRKPWVTQYNDRSEYFKGYIDSINRIINISGKKYVMVYGKLGGSSFMAEIFLHLIDIDSIGWYYVRRLSNGKIFEIYINYDTVRAPDIFYERMRVERHGYTWYFENYNKELINVLREHIPEKETTNAPIDKF